MKVRIGFQFWLSSTLYGYPKYILQDSPIRGLTKCCGGSETKWIIIIYMTMLIRFLKKKKPTDAVRVARPPRIGVSPGFDSQDSVNFFIKYCFPNLYWIHWVILGEVIRPSTPISKSLSFKYVPPLLLLVMESDSRSEDRLGRAVLAAGEGEAKEIRSCKGACMKLW